MSETFNFYSFLFNVFCSFIASFIFIFSLLFLLKPKIKIVKLISRQDSPFDEVSQICYGFKVINKSLFSTYDIEAKASYFVIKQGENGIVDKIYKKIKLNTHKIDYIPSNKLFDKKYGDHCIQFFTYEDLLGEMNKGGIYVNFQICAKHGLTGLTNVFNHTFTSKKDIQDGGFVSGNCEKIK